MSQDNVTIIDFSDILTIINACISGLLLLVTIISVVCAFKAYYHQKERAKKDAACQLARVYADEVLPQYQIVVGVLTKSELLDFIKRVFPMDNLCSFNFQEMMSFSMAAEINRNELISKMETFNPLDILDVLTGSTSSVVDRNVLNAEYSIINEETRERIPRNPLFLQDQFMDTISHLLNTLEWFSMNCRYGLADEELLYQSLHQTFLSTVWMLYYFISKNNFNNEDKYFTNIIWLFKKWKERLSEQTLSAALEKQAAIVSMQTAKEKYDNAGNNYAGKALK